MHIQFFQLIYFILILNLFFFLLLYNQISNFKMNEKEKNHIGPIEIDYFQNLKNACLLGIDIGGSLVKIAYSSSYECKTAAFSEVS